MASTATRHRPVVVGRQGAVASEHTLSAMAGMRLFFAGGNAIDAAVAAGFVEGVVNPHMHTLGGEVPMLIYSAREQRVVAINGNTMAPRAATIEAFRQRGLDLIPGQGARGRHFSRRCGSWSPPTSGRSVTTRPSTSTCSPRPSN